jgi:hypothetical protein
MKHPHSFLWLLATLSLQSQLLIFYPLCCVSSHTQKQGSPTKIQSQVSMPAIVGNVHDPAEPGGLAINYLAAVQDQFHLAFDVYKDADAGGNHFPARGRFNSPGDGDTILPMVEDYPINPHSGLTCIQCRFISRGRNWGGWYMMNGTLGDKELEPKENWGDVPNAGIDLEGATKLTLWARSDEDESIQVEFFTLGIGWDPDAEIRTKPYPDSSPKVSLGYITLSKKWTQYSIDLTGKDLHSVLGGLGWVTSAEKNGNRDVIFYIDDIQFDKPRLDEPRFLQSYECIASTNDVDRVSRNVSYLYDNCVALIAFLAAGETRRAQLIADAIIFAQENDRYYDDGRVRNSYQAGDLKLPPGWTPNGKIDAVRTPGFSDKISKKWVEDEFQMSCHTGNVAWAMLALLAYYRTEGGDKYLKAAERMGEWVEKNCRSEQGAGGYTAGFDGWEPMPRKLMHKATEHSIDLHAAYRQLYDLTRNPAWNERAQHAKQFFTSVMWDSIEGKFWTGTGADGATIFKDVIPVDIQAWALCSLKEESQPFLRALQYAETHHKAEGGYDFNQDLDGGVWMEGTGQMAVAYNHACQRVQSQAIVKYLKSNQLSSGGIYASTKDGLTTGFTLNDGQPWLYFQRVHVGATGWLVLSELGINPFWGALKANPRIDSVTLLSKKVLSISGSLFCNLSTVLINERNVTDHLQSLTESNLRLQGKAKKLGLRSGDNRIQVIDMTGGTSKTFVFKFD